MITKINSLDKKEIMKRYKEGRSIKDLTLNQLATGYYGLMPKEKAKKLAEEFVMMQIIYGFKYEGKNYIITMKRK